MFAEEDVAAFAGTCSFVSSIFGEADTGINENMPSCFWVGEMPAEYTENKDGKGYVCELRMEKGGQLILSVCTIMNDTKAMYQVMGYAKYNDIRCCQY